MEREKTEHERVRSEEGITFEAFKRGSPTPPAEPAVTIQRRKIFSMNRAAAEALGSPEAVEFLYAERERIIGFRAADPGSPGAFVLRPQGKSSSYETAGGAFITYHGIPHETARRYKARKSGNMLLIDLKEGGVEVSGGRTKKTSEGSRA